MCAAVSNAVLLISVESSQGLLGTSQRVVAGTQMSEHLSPSILLQIIIVSFFLASHVFRYMPGLKNRYRAIRKEVSSSLLSINQIRGLSTPVLDHF